jgi:PPM family protein phosphatase
MTPATQRFLSAALSDQGPVRPNNEDRVHCDDSRGIYLVVDGMGGHEAGEHAAEIAVERLRLRLERQTGTVEQRIREAITLANNAILETAEAQPEWHGMACVLTVAVIEGNRVVVGHVGDSRLYKITHGAITKITHDHSPVGEREDGGELTEEEAMRHPRRNEVFRDVGSVERTPEDPEFIEIQETPFEPDGALLLCSDGLSDAVPSREILHIVERNAADRRRAVEELVQAATKSGKDNVSAILVVGDRFSPLGERPRSDEDTGRLNVAAPSRSWYMAPPAWLAAGVVMGALAALGFFAWIAGFRFEPATTTTIIGPPTSLQEALAKAKPGSTIEVTAGTYTGPVQLKEGVDLIARPPYEAVILGTLTANGIRRGRVEGFRIREGGVRLHDSDIILDRNEISDCRTAGIEFTGNSRGAVIGCSIHNNAGPGILVADSATPSIERSLLYDNAAAAGALGPGLLIRSQFLPHVIENTFYGNGAEAVWLTQGGEEIAKHNHFLAGGKVEKSPKLRTLAPAGVNR